MAIKVVSAEKNSISKADIKKLEKLGLTVILTTPGKYINFNYIPEVDSK